MPERSSFTSCRRSNGAAGRPQTGQRAIRPRCGVSSDATLYPPDDVKWRVRLEGEHIQLVPRFEAIPLTSMLLKSGLDGIPVCRAADRSHVSDAALNVYRNVYSNRAGWRLFAFADRHRLGKWLFKMIASVPGQCLIVHPGRQSLARKHPAVELVQIRATWSCTPGGAFEPTRPFQ